MNAESVCEALKGNGLLQEGLFIPLPCTCYCYVIISCVKFIAKKPWIWLLLNIYKIRSLSAISDLQLVSSSTKLKCIMTNLTVPYWRMKINCSGVAQYATLVLCSHIPFSQGLLSWFLDNWFNSQSSCECNWIHAYNKQFSRVRVWLDRCRCSLLSKWMDGLSCSVEACHIRYFTVLKQKTFFNFLNAYVLLWCCSWCGLGSDTFVQEALTYCRTVLLMNFTYF